MTPSDFRVGALHNKAISVRALEPGDWPLIEELFGGKGACGGCWCMWWRVPKGGRLWEECKGSRNKRAFKRLVSAGKVFGCLAFSGDAPVGWCCVGPRADFPRLERTKALKSAWTSSTWSVTCFYIAAGWRRKGVGRALLAEAIELASANGASELEAYPVRPKSEVGIPAAFAWTGVPSMFESFGFRNITTPGNTRDVYVLRLAAKRRTEQRKRRAGASARRSTTARTPGKSGPKARARR